MWPEPTAFSGPRELTPRQRKYSYTSQATNARKRADRLRAEADMLDAEAINFEALANAIKA